MAGASWVGLLRDYIESAVDRGAAVPARLKLRSVLGLMRLAYLGHSIIHRRAPRRRAYLSELRNMRSRRNSKIKKLDELSANVETPLRATLLGGGHPLVACDRLRFADVQRLMGFGVINNSIRGALMRPNAENPHAPPRQRACPRMGANGSTMRGNSLIGPRDSRAKQNGSRPTPAIHRLSRRRELECSEPLNPPPTPTDRQKLSLARAGLDDMGGARTLCIAPRNACVRQQVNTFETREISVIGRWASKCRMRGAIEVWVRTG